MVECEFISGKSFPFLFGVLIDTWWNVNENTIVQEIDLSIVLIDTWWNVNVSSIKKALGSGTRFNRYMVECEFTL